MSSWSEENLAAVFEYPFDFERYIEERLREVEDLEERAFAKKIVSEGIGALIRCTEQKYDRLQQRVYEEMGADESMNWFVRDELFPMESRRVLLLKFGAKNRDFFLNDSMVRFAISQLQLEINEYRCVGVILESMERNG